MSLTVLDPGLYSLLVDAGRPSSRRLGVPVGGGADRAALALGNGLVGNGPHALALELTMSGPTLRAEHRTACVIFGAPFFAAVANKARVEAGTTFTLEPGDVLKIGGTPQGVRGYLCVAGGFAGQSVLASSSALEPIQTDGTLACGESRIGGRSLPFVSLPVAVELANTLRVVPGPQYDWFLDATDFFNAEYEVLPASNRMGVRLRGPKLERRPGELISEPVAPGAVQITNDGQPIVLGVDGQTIGGYPKIAHVVRADLDRLAQLRPGSSLKFRQVIADEATRAAAERDSSIREWLLRLKVTFGL